MSIPDRFRRPKAHEQLLDELTGKNGIFNTKVDALMFAAALGKYKNCSEEFDEFEEPIRLSLVEGRQYGDVLIEILAALEDPTDTNVLSEDRIAERIRTFEEYANGGLSYLQGELNRAANRDLDILVSDLVMKALMTPDGEEDELDDLMSEAGLEDW